MMFTYTLDVSRYTNKEVAGLLNDGVITDEECDSWLTNQKQALRVGPQPVAREAPRTQLKFESK